MVANVTSITLIVTDMRGLSLGGTPSFSACFPEVAVVETPALAMTTAAAAAAAACDGADMRKCHLMVRTAIATRPACTTRVLEGSEMVEFTLREGGRARLPASSPAPPSWRAAVGLVHFVPVCTGSDSTIQGDFLARAF